MKRIIIIVFFINVISKIMGFGREIALSYFFGATQITDAYLVSTIFPSFFQIIVIGILAAYIPIYSDINQKLGNDRALEFTNNFLNIILFFSLGTFLISYIFSENIVKIFLINSNENTLKLAIYFTKITIGSIFFTVISTLFSGFLQLNNRFFIVAFRGIILNLVNILGVYISYKYNFKLLAMFFVISAFSHFFILIPSILKTGYHYKFILNLKDKYLKEILLISFPVILGSSIEQLNLLVDRSIASRLGEGAISILNYSSKLNIAILSLSVTVILGVLFPKIAKLVSSNDMLGLKKQVRQITNFILIFTIPIVSGLIYLGKDLVNLVFGRGNITDRDLKLIGISLVFYSLCLLGLSFRDLFTKIFYSFKNTKVPVINSAIGIGLNIILNLTLPKYFGIPGIALATSISSIFISILLGISLTKNYGNLFNIQNLKVFFKVIFASLLMIFGIYFSKRFGNDIFMYGKFNVLIYTLIGIIIYFIVIYFSKIEEVDEIKIVTIKKLKQILKK